MLPLNQALQAGFAAFQRGDLSAARRSLGTHEHPKALHLRALVEKAAGNFDQAAPLFEQAARADPHDPEIANNYARLGLDIGDPVLAEREFRRAVALKPDFMQAGLALGSLLTDQQRWLDACNVYLSLKQQLPNDIYVRYGLGMTWLELGHTDDAEALFDSLIREGTDRSEIRFMRGRARLEQRRVEDALDDLRQAHSKAPSNLTLKALAGAVYMSGDTSGFDALVDDALGRSELCVMAAELRRQSGDPDAAIAALDTARRQHTLAPDSWIVAATAHIDANRAAAAEEAAHACLAEAPDNRIIRASLATALLMQGKAREALDVARAMRKAEPNGQHWIAYEATALRLLGAEEYNQLVDLDRFVRAYTLPVPEGFETLDDFNAAFLEALDRWQPYALRPLDQSLRDGTQTPRDLTAIDDTTVEAFVRALDEPIRRYMQDVGADAGHPLTARNNGNYRITGCWSVRLKGGGWHVNHVHPEGWISSAYYVTVPEGTGDDADKAGWIKFGEPPFETVPPTPAQKWVQPTAGLLVLFPSFLWHGTVPIRDNALRVTAPFDAVPA